MNNYYQPGYEDKRKAKEINLRELYKVVKRRLLVILAATIIAAAIGMIKSAAPVTSLYQSSARVIIGADDQSITTLQVVITDPSVLDQVIKQLKLSTTSDALASRITVASINSSQVVSITAKDPNPAMAAKIVNTTAKVFKDEVPKIVGQDYVRLLSMGKVSTAPINNGQNNKLLIYIIIGLVAGIGLAFLIDSLDDSIYSEKEAEKLLGLPVLGRISRINKKNVQGNKKKLEPKLRGESIGSK